MIVDRYNGMYRAIDSNATSVIEHPEISTAIQCRDACLGPNGDALLPSGQSCIGADFMNGNCRLVVSVIPVQSSGKSKRYDVRHLCTTANSLCKNQLCFVLTIF